MKLSLNFLRDYLELDNDIDIKKEYQWMNEAGFINRNYTFNERAIWSNFGGD